MKATLLLALVVTVGLWIGAGYYFTHRISETERNTAAVQTRYVQAQDNLTTVRLQILIGSVYVRDALLDPDADLDSYRLQLEEVYAEMDQALDSYVPVLDTPEERDRLARLRTLVEDFRTSGLQVIGTGSKPVPRVALRLLRTVVVPKRNLVIDISNEVQRLNRNAFLGQQAQVAEIYAVSHQRLWQTVGVALAFSLAVGLFAAWRAGSLEQRLRAQKEVEARTAREMQDLSAKLITLQEEERRTIARELHDEVGQLLAALKVELTLAEKKTAAGADGSDALNGARTMADAALATVRDLSHLLHPAVLDDLGLPDAVDWFLGEFGRRYRLRTNLVRQGLDERLAPEVEAAAYRIVQEALTNIVKHARATSCRVTIDRQAARLTVTIDDDGVGFGNAAPTAPDGLGLIGMRERATRVGGSIQFARSPEGGARVGVHLPARPRRDDTGADDAPGDVPLTDPMVADG